MASAEESKSTAYHGDDEDTTYMEVKNDRSCHRKPRRYSRKKRDIQLKDAKLCQHLPEMNPIVWDYNTKLNSHISPVTSKGDKSICHSDLSKAEVQQEHNMSPPSESMMWTQASWDRHGTLPKVAANQGKTDANSSKNSDKNALVILPIGKDKTNTNASCLTGCTSKTSSSENLSRANGESDELRVLYTTPERLIILQGEVDKTRDILKPFVVNRARGMIDWALDELRRSIKLSAAADQEFLRVGDKSDDRPKRHWVRELLSKKSSNTLVTSSSRIPVSQTLTPAVAASTESAFSLIAPVRNVSVRLLGDEATSESVIAPKNPDENPVDNVDQSLHGHTSPNNKAADTSKSNSKQKHWWSFAQKQSQQDTKNAYVKHLKQEESDSKPKRKDWRKSGNMLKWKRLCEALGVTKSDSRSHSSVAGQEEQNSVTDTDKPTTSNECKQKPGHNTQQNSSTSEGKLSHTLRKIRTGWKKVNDWLDE